MVDAAATTPSKGYAKGRARKLEIILAAIDLFGEVGYHGTTLRELAARVGLTHPGLLHHFGSKEELLRAVLEYRDSQDRAWIERVHGGGLERLRAIFALVQRNAGRRGVVELFTVLGAEATDPSHPAHAYFVERYAVTIDQVERAYARAAADGVLVDGIVPATAARQLVALMDGAQVQWLLDDATDMVALVREHLQRQLLLPL